MTMQSGFDDVATLDAATPADEAQPDARSGGDELESLTPAELRVLIRETMRPELDNLYRGTDSQLTRFRNEFTQAMQAIARLEDEMGETKESRAMLRALTKQTVSAEDIAAEADQLRVEAEGKARERELTALRQQAAARQAQSEQPTPSPQSAVEREFGRVVRPSLTRYAKAAGLELDSVPLPAALGALPNGDPDWESYIEQAEKAIDEAAAKAERQTRVNRPRATPDTTRAAGSGATSHEAVWAAYGRGELSFSDPRVRAAGNALGAL